MNLVKTGRWIFVDITLLYVPPVYYVYYGQLCWIKLSAYESVVYVILRCGQLSVRLSVCPSVPAFASMFHHRLAWYLIRWLESPSACGSQISKVTWQI